MTDTRDRALVDGFIRRHYSVRGAAALHRNAIGWDLLRAPANVMLAPVFLIARLVAVCAHAVGLRRVARYIATRRLQFRSDVNRAIEAALIAEVIAPRREGQPPPEPAVIRCIEDYTAVRGAISEIGTTLVVLTVGYALYHTVTPGVLTLAPVVTDRVATAREIASFPLGSWLGAAWHGIFPAPRPVWQLVAVGMSLVVVFSLVTTFAGVLADPLQARLGWHRRRLLRLLVRVDRADETAPRVEGEFLVARAADIADAAAAVLRFFRS